MAKTSYSQLYFDGIDYYPSSGVNLATKSYVDGEIANTPSKMINAQTGTSYTLALSDSGILVTLSNASPITLTVDTHANVPFAIGSRIDIVQKGEGKVTIAPAIGVTINSKTGNKSINGRYVAVSLIKEGTNVWYLIGDLIA